MSAFEECCLRDVAATCRANAALHHVPLESVEPLNIHPTNDDIIATVVVDNTINLPNHLSLGHELDLASSALGLVLDEHTSTYVPPSKQQWGYIHKTGPIDRLMATRAQWNEKLKNYMTSNSDTQASSATHEKMKQLSNTIRDSSIVSSVSSIVTPVVTETLVTAQTTTAAYVQSLSHHKDTIQTKVDSLKSEVSNLQTTISDVATKATGRATNEPLLRGAAQYVWDSALGHYVKENAQGWQQALREFRTAAWTSALQQLSDVPVVGSLTREQLCREREQRVREMWDNSDVHAAVTQSLLQSKAARAQGLTAEDIAADWCADLPLVATAEPSDAINTVSAVTKGDFSSSDASTALSLVASRAVAKFPVETSAHASDTIVSSAAVGVHAAVTDVAENVIDVAHTTEEQPHTPALHNPPSPMKGSLGERAWGQEKAIKDVFVELSAQMRIPASSTATDVSVHTPESSNSALERVSTLPVVGPMAVAAATFAATQRERATAWAKRQLEAAIDPYRVPKGYTLVPERECGMCQFSSTIDKYRKKIFKMTREDLAGKPLPPTALAKSQQPEEVMKQTLRSIEEPPTFDMTRSYENASLASTVYVGETVEQTTRTADTPSEEHRAPKKTLGLADYVQYQLSGEDLLRKSPRHKDS